MYLLYIIIPDIQVIRLDTIRSRWVSSHFIRLNYILSHRDIICLQKWIIVQTLFVINNVHSDFCEYELSAVYISIYVCDFCYFCEYELSVVYISIYVLLYQSDYLYCLKLCSNYKVLCFLNEYLPFNLVQIWIDAKAAWLILMQLNRKLIVKVLHKCVILILIYQNEIMFANIMKIENSYNR